MKSSTFMNDDEPFNMGFSTLVRINYELWTCNNSQKDNNLIDWHNALLNLGKEIYPFMKKAELEKHEELKKNANKEYSEYITLLNSNANFEDGTPIIPSQKVYNALYDWEIHTRYVLYRAKLLMKGGEDNSESVGLK